MSVYRALNTVWDQSVNWLLTFSLGLLNDLEGVVGTMCVACFLLVHCQLRVYIGVGLVWPNLTLSIPLDLVHCITHSICLFVLHGSLNQLPTARVVCNCLEAVILSFYLLICHYSVLTLPQALLAPSRPFQTLIHSFISCLYIPLAQFCSNWSNSLSSSFTSLKQVSAFHLDLLLIPCHSKLQSHSLSARQLFVHFPYRFASFSTVFDQLIYRPSCELMQLLHLALNSSQFLL
jgi:hypothetical protein